MHVCHFVCRCFSFLWSTWENIGSNFLTEAIFLRPALRRKFSKESSIYKLTSSYFISAPTNAPENCGDPNDPQERLKRDCVGILAAFRLKDLSRRLIVVADTHIYW